MLVAKYGRIMELVMHRKTHWVSAKLFRCVTNSIILPYLATNIANLSAAFLTFGLLGEAGIAFHL
jgi:hypothetical protein